jgi:GTP-binding protein
MNELASFGAGLEDKPMLLVANKLDSAIKDKLAALKKLARKKKLELHAISAVTGEGVDKLKYAIGERVQKMRKAQARKSTPDARITA